MLIRDNYVTRLTAIVFEPFPTGNDDFFYEQVIQIIVLITLLFFFSGTFSWFSLPAITYVRWYGLWKLRFGCWYFCWYFRKPLLCALFCGLLFGRNGCCCKPDMFFAGIIDVAPMVAGCGCNRNGWFPYGWPNLLLVKLTEKKTWLLWLLLVNTVLRSIKNKILNRTK